MSSIPPALTFLLFFAFTLGFTLGCVFPAQSSAQEQEPANSTQVIHGTVLNSVTHGPIARALVRYAQQAATLTDSEGHFEFNLSAQDAPHGGLHVYATRPGFFDDPNGRSQVEATSNGELTIYLVPEALIKGRVVLSTNDAASGVNVQIFSREVRNGIFRWMPRQRVRTNSSGEFRFADLEAGEYKVITHEYMENDPTITLPGGPMFGFPPVYYPNATDFGSAKTIQLTAGEIFEADLSLVRRPYYDVKIPIANPLEQNHGLNVTVSPRAGRGPGYSLGYNWTKQIIEGSLPNGTYLVEASSWDQAGRTGAVDLTVAGAPAVGASVVLTPNSSISLNVKEEFSNQEDRSGSWSDGRHTFSYRGPRTYLQVTAESADDFERRNSSLRQPTGQNDDSLVVDNLSPGRYWLRFDTSRGYVASATMGGIDLLHQPIAISSGANATIDVTMRDDSAEIDGTVAGVVATAAAPGAGYAVIGGGRMSNPIIVGAPAYIYFVPLADSPGKFEHAGVDAEGKFTAHNITPGTYRVMAFKNAQPELPYREAEAMKAYESKGQIVHVSPGQNASVQLQLISESE